MGGADGIVWLASYPKSGNTWLRVLLANLLANEDHPVDVNAIDTGNVAVVVRGLLERFALIDSSLLTDEETDRLRPLMSDVVVAEAPSTAYVKVHDAYRCLPDGSPLLGRHSRAALYVVRDPRDVAVSMTFHYGVPLDATVASLNQADFTIGGAGSRPLPQVSQRVSDWSTHVRSWTEQRDIPVHVVRYEALRADPVTAFSDALRFLGIDASAATIERAVRFSDLSELQRQEADTGFGERFSRATAPFFRAGRAGGWVDHFTPAQHDALVGAHGTVMTQYGYV